MVAAAKISAEEEERERKREAIRARIAAQRAARGEEEAAAASAATSGGHAEVGASAEDEKERKREEIRQRIAAQKAAEAEEQALAEKADRERGNVELHDLIDQMGQAALRSDGHRNLAQGNGACDQDAADSDFLDHVYPPLPLPTHEAGVEDGVTYKMFDDEDEMAAIVALIDKDLSEPYSILTYRYFVYNWSQHTHMAMYNGKCCGVVVCKLEQHRDYFRGYIAMLAVDEVLRGKGIGSCLVSKAIRSMRSEGCEEVVLETECRCAPAGSPAFLALDLNPRP
jgi:peptide alpha-N-acetyltransferase